MSLDEIRSLEDKIDDLEKRALRWLVGASLTILISFGGACWWIGNYVGELSRDIEMAKATDLKREDHGERLAVLESQFGRIERQLDTLLSRTERNGVQR